MMKWIIVFYFAESPYFNQATTETPSAAKATWNQHEHDTGTRGWPKQDSIHISRGEQSMTQQTETSNILNQNVFLFL